MKAILCPRYGPPEVLRAADIPEPQPREGEILIEVRASAVNSADARIRAMRMPSPLFEILGRAALGLRGPRRPVLGAEAAGVIRSVGAGVTAFRPGDAVLAVLGLRFGGHAERVCVRAKAPVVRVPEGLTFEQAAAVPFGFLTALYYLRDLGNVRSGMRVLVVGASGSVGLAAVQLARMFGAEVTGVCSAGNAALVLDLGARRVIDYHTSDFTRERGTYDIIFDTVGVTTFARTRAVLSPMGRFLPAVMTGRELLQIARTSFTKGARVVGGVTPERRDDLAFILGNVASGELRAVIDCALPWGEFVEAHRRVDSGRKVGAVVLRFNDR